MVAIIDYGVGNLFSLESSFKAIGEEVIVTSDKSVLRSADRIVLPGVGAFSDAVKKLSDSGLFQEVISLAKSGKPILGICLGMQLLLDKSYEYGCYDGLGLIKGEIRPISEVVPNGYKIPHMGWNALNLAKESPIYKYVKEGDCVYFVHSYHACNCNDVTATAEYGAYLTASVEKDNVFGCQFHPEKSGEVGLKILKAFCEIGNRR